MIETDDDRATRVFAEHRELLFSIVYNVLGSVADTEDVLQDTWLAWAARYRAGAAEIEHPRAYLVRTAVNRGLDRRSTINRRRETYVGPWLPEPLVSDPADDAAERTLRAESVSMAMLVVLETLSPLERAVFVLHDVFGYPHAEIAEILGRNVAAVRQLTHRAREHVHARRPRGTADPRVQRRVTEKFLAAQHDGDVAGLLELLAPDVAFWSDGGGKRRAALRTIYGAEKVSRLLTNAKLVEFFNEATLEYRSINGDPSVVVYAEGGPYAVVVLDIDPESARVLGIYAVTNPDKLTGIED
ncbi:MULTISPECIES: RNA polymerase sigma factor SigJ [unclassified Nocardia]|uniref:RNA polymerase sigma factor SigJ n=1 Tax=unclassified Nocardia TaxID=2637762 RepID=UPI001CE4409C|nr:MULTISPECIES: RNA polymerase sigma factor SigJ [unclassified Nocardia]